MSLQEKLSNLPEKPGVYLFKDSAGQILYVGKASVLRNRVLSYFLKDGPANPRLQRLADKIADLDYFLCDSELEALMLEYNLIKEHHPPFNVRFRDDKRYPLIKLVLTDPFPYVTIKRRREADGNRYFGPYVSSQAMRRTLKLVRKIYQIRSCTMKITGRDRPCLYYHLKECTAPCMAAVSREDYLKSVHGMVQFLDGKAEPVLRDLQKRMEEASGELEFERAAVIRDQIESVKQVMVRQKVASGREVDEDYLGMASREGLSAAAVFHVRQGNLVGKDHVVFEDAETSEEASLSAFLKKYYAERTPIPSRIYLPFPLEEAPALEEFLSEKSGRPVGLEAARRGEKKKMLDLVRKNVEHQLGLALLKEARVRGMMEALEGLRDLFRLPALPFRIEGYDISTLFGQEAVGSLVVFQGGKPEKGHYRKFAVRVKDTPDDLAMMQEVLARRLERLAQGEDDESFAARPDLILLDGGRGQLSVGVQVLRRFNRSEIPVLSLAKEEEEIYSPDLPQPLKLSRHHAGLKLLQHVRDEAHRFAVSFHKTRRDKKVTRSSLEAVPGVGPKRARMLLEVFGSLDQIRVAEVDQIAKVLRASPSLAAKIWQKVNEVPPE